MERQIDCLLEEASLLRRDCLNKVISVESENGPPSDLMSTLYPWRGPGPRSMNILNGGGSQTFPQPTSNSSS
jgi:hypothetical protein